ncbi:MAG: sensor histidine kinase [Bacteroidia bacterium]|jgi:PAS domain S-box-containing protein
MVYWYTRFLDVLFIRSAKHAIAEDNLSDRQRFNLFRTLSLTTFLISLAITFQVITFDYTAGAFGLVLCFLTATLAMNYFLLNAHKNYNVAYRISLFSSFAVLHFVTYYSGGIRNSGMMYTGGLILASFMLLGNKEGKLISGLSVVNLIFFFIYSSTFGRDVRNIVDSDQTGFMLNLDYFVTYSTATLLIYSLSNNLLSSKNIVISKVMESKIELEKKNEELKKLSLVASKSDNAILITGSGGNIEWVNDGFIKTTGFLIEEVNNRPPSDVLKHVQSSEQEYAELMDKLMLKQSYSGEIQFYHKNGQTIWLQLNVTPVADEFDHSERIVYVCSDITDKKHQEAKLAEYYRYLEKANKELDKFAYVVSHDLKAPLRAIANLSTWIEEDIHDTLNSDTREHFNMLKGRVNRMEGLINGILDYSRADRIKSPNSTVDTAEIIHEVLDLLLVNNDKSVDVCDNLPIIETERMKFQQVVSNLVSNAFKHNEKENAALKIRYQECEEFHVFSFQDNGPGIESQYFEKIFVIFQTLKARDAFESTGVGLAIVKKIMDEMGGKILVESTPGEFSRFDVYWPKETTERYKPFQISLQQGVNYTSVQQQNLQQKNIA